ncbi:Photoactive yellow protein, partial [Bienertia sinuspersici]
MEGVGIGLGAVIRDENGKVVAIACSKGKKIGRSPSDMMLEDIDFSSSSFDDFTCNHVCRVGNTIAHLAARLAPLNGEEHVYLNSFPQ